MTPRVVAIYLEEWQATAEGGRWRYCGGKHGGFSEVFRGASKEPEADDTESESLSSGAQIECELLANKTRKGGWMARARQQELAGPITNSDDVPVSMTAGTIVCLRVGAVNSEATRIQFDWVPQSSKASTA